MSAGDTSPTSDLAERRWHALSPEDALEALDVEAGRGLDEDEVERRRQAHGANRLPERGRETAFATFLRQFRDPLIYILLLAGGVSLAIGSVSDAVFIFAVLLFNASLGAYQEYRAESAAEALKQVVRIEAEVLRDGRRRKVASEALVPGDVVVLRAGTAAPADLRLLEAQDLSADESMLTGESVPVRKSADAEPAEDAPLGDRETMVHAGSSVVAGQGKGVVCRTGETTEIGRIAESLVEDEPLPPLVLRMKRFTRVIAIAILLVIVVLGLVQLVRGKELVDIFFLAVALSVSAIPAGLPVATTVALSVASNRMARRDVIVRKLPAVEGLGACTLIASDKTGTLTENELTARILRPLGGEEAEVGGGPREMEGGVERDGEALDLEAEDALRRMIVTGALCNEGEVEETGDGPEIHGDTVDVAFLVLAGKAGVARDDLLDERPELGRIPFDSERRFAASFHREGDGVAVHVKGAAETVATLCDVDAEAVREEEETLASKGYRVLGLARGTSDEAAAEAADPDSLTGLEFLGLVGLIDPVRAEVPDAVGRCRDAGVEVRMVTGDHPATALGIARELEFAEARDQVLAGADFGEGESEEEAGRIREARVYARVEPRQKTAIVQRLQEAGHFVAVTGDGVNDAPALRGAHVGVSMGEGGTDVARSASDLILTDDNFASIVDGIEEGRVAYDNIRKVVWLLISTGAAGLLLFVLAVIFDTPMPLTPVQLLWMNLVTNGIQDVALALEKGEPDVLKRRPRRPDERIFNRLMIEQVLTSGLYMGLVAFAVFHYLVEWMGMDAFEARNHLLLLMVLFENVHVFNVRSETRSAFRVPLSNNVFLIGAVILAQGVHVASMHIPGWRDVLQIEPVSIATWGVLLAITLSKFAVVEIYKHVRGRALAERAATA